MGDMYRIDLSNLTISERKKVQNMLEYADEVFWDANQPYIFDVLWMDSSNISETLKLPSKCNVKKI
ncbi:MAG: hypothetical protein K1W06_07345 [Lachnospiraceae bacterium]